MPFVRLQSAQRSRASVIPMRPPPRLFRRSANRLQRPACRPPELQTACRALDGSGSALVGEVLPEDGRGRAQRIGGLPAE